jgi:hypothetical protein
LTGRQARNRVSDGSVLNDDVGNERRSERTRTDRDSEGGKQSCDRPSGDPTECDVQRSGCLPHDCWHAEPAIPGLLHFAETTAATLPYFV